MQSMRLLLITLLFLFGTQSLQAQDQLRWQTAIGGTAYDSGYRMIPVENNCFIVGGTTSSNDGPAKGNHAPGKFDLLIMKVSATGHVIWSTVVGGSDNEDFGDMQATPDGGVVVIGTTLSYDGDVSGNHGKMDFLVAKLDRMGEVEWTKCYGGTGNDKGYCIATVEDKGYLIGGQSGSLNGNMRGNRGLLDMWVARIDLAGNIEKSKSMGGRGNEKATQLISLKKGKFIVVGVTNSSNGDVEGFMGGKDVWINCISNNFDVIWQRCFGGSDFDEAHCIRRTHSGDYVLSGTTFSYDNDNDLTENKGLGDSWMFMVSEEGNLAWSECYGGAQSDGGNAVAETPDRGFILVGMTNSRQFLPTRNQMLAEGYKQRLYDGWCVRTDSMGRKLWHKAFGGENFEYLNDVIALEDGNYLALGFAESQKGDLRPLKKGAENDFWMLRFADPADPVDNILKSELYAIGFVRSMRELMPLKAEVRITDNEDLSLLSKGESNAERGLYYQTLGKTGNYSIMVIAPGHMFYGGDLTMPESLDNPEIRLDALLQPIEVGARIIMDNIFFDTGRWELKEASYPELERIRYFLKVNPNLKIEISGHTDNTGNVNTKKELSLKRATRVRDYLLKAGIAGKQMEVAGYGMDRPIAPNSSPEGRQKNRRVEIAVVEIFD